MEYWMAEQVDLGDGNKVPQWVTEETGQKLIDKMEDLAGANKKLTDAFEKFIKETTKANKKQEEKEEDYKLVVIKLQEYSLDHFNLLNLLFNLVL